MEGFGQGCTVWLCSREATAEKSGWKMGSHGRVQMRNDGALGCGGAVEGKTWLCYTLDVLLR